MVATRVNVQKILRRDGTFFFLQPNDIVYLPKTWITGTAEVMRDLRDVLLFRGWAITFTDDIRVVD